MNGDAFAASDVAHDLLAANGIATARAIDEQVVLALYLQRVRAGKMQFAYRVGHAGFARTAWLDLWSGFGLRQIRAAGSQPVEHLAGGVLAQAQRRQKIGGRSHAVFIGDAAQVLVGDLSLWNLVFTGFAFEQLAADLDGAAAMILVEPVLDLVAGAGAFNECQPIAAGFVVLLGDDLDDIAGTQLGAQGRPCGR